MADETHVRILEKGIEVWNDWRRTNPQICPNLSKLNCRGENFEEANLANADLTWIILQNALLSDADLSGADLSHADLAGADLSKASLRQAILVGAQLLRADFTQADLGRSDLSEANLDSTDFDAAYLGGANFRGAKLVATYLNEAHLIEADFSNCTMSRVWLERVDLSRSKGLETVRHTGYSTIGIDTVYRSVGNIPEAFMRGAGISEPLIELAKSLVGALQSIQFYSCFISYSHKDKAFARKLHDSLHARGVRCWLDEHQLRPGDDIYHEVDRGIRLWDKMLLCCSENSLKSWWVDNEIGTAFEKEQQLMKDRGGRVQVLVPLNLDGYLFSDKCKSKHGYLAQVRRRLAADFTESSGDAKKFDAQVERLILAMRADEGAREKPPKQRL